MSTRARAGLLTPPDTVFPNLIIPKDPTVALHILDIMSSSLGGVADVDV